MKCLGEVRGGKIEDGLGVGQIALGRGKVPNWTSGSKYQGKGREEIYFASAAR